jgi:hypothetical protein
LGVPSFYEKATFAVAFFIHFISKEVNTCGAKWAFFRENLKNIRLNLILGKHSKSKMHLSFFVLYAPLQDEKFHL